MRKSLVVLAVVGVVVFLGATVRGEEKGMVSTIVNWFGSSAAKLPPLAPAPVLYPVGNGTDIYRLQQGNRSFYVGFAAAGQPPSGEGYCIGIDGNGNAKKVEKGQSSNGIKCEGSGIWITRKNGDVVFAAGLVKLGKGTRLSVEDVMLGPPPGEISVAGGKGPGLDGGKAIAGVPKGNPKDCKPPGSQAESILRTAAEVGARDEKREAADRDALEKAMSGGTAATGTERTEPKKDD